MATKKSRLIERARQNARKPRPPRLLEPEAPRKKVKGYKVVAVSLYTPEFEWVEQTTAALKRAGSPKANRSLVVREAILRLQEGLKNKEPRDILADFSEHDEARRSGGGS
jgi:hypothetical protein